MRRPSVSVRPVRAPEVSGIAEEPRSGHAARCAGRSDARLVAHARGRSSGAPITPRTVLGADSDAGTVLEMLDAALAEWSTSARRAAGAWPEVAPAGLSSAQW